MPEPDGEPEFPFNPTWPPEEGRVPLWLRTAAQEASRDQTKPVCGRLGSKIFDDEEAGRIFQELKSSRKSWTESEFINAILGDMRWTQLLLENLKTDDEEQCARLDEFSDSLKEIKDLLDKIKDLLDKIKESQEREWNSGGSAGSAVATIIAGTIIGIAVGCVLGYSLKTHMHFDIDARTVRPLSIPTHFDIDSSTVHPLSIPVTIQATVRPEIDLSGIKASLAEPIPIKLTPEIDHNGGATATTGSRGIAVPLDIHIQGKIGVTIVGPNTSVPIAQILAPYERNSKITSPLVF